MTFCTNCGKKLGPGATRCDACGAAIIAVTPTPPEAPKSGFQSNVDQKASGSGAGTTGQPFAPSMGGASPVLMGQQVGRVLGGRYQLSQVIGSGGMGEIYRARRLHIGDTVAVKVLRPDVVENEKSRQRFYREARAAAMLHHPNAVVIHDFGEDTDGTAYIVMELLVGRSLRQVLIDQGSVDSIRCFGIIRQACAALDAGHRNGIVHRDIKPDNIILLDSNDGVDHLKILDFGIAKLRDQALDTLSMEQRLTNVGTVIGTPHYMAPEQCQGEEADSRSDIYSLGVVLYELLTGVAPFLAKTPTGVAIKHVTEKPRPLRDLQPNVTENVERVVLKALEKDPNTRQQTALELSREFETAIRNDGATGAFLRSGEQPRIDKETIPVKSELKTELINNSAKTAPKPAPSTPQDFATAITPPLHTDQLRDAPTSEISEEKKTLEQRQATDALRTIAIPVEPPPAPPLQTEILAEKTEKPPVKSAPIVAEAPPLQTEILAEKPEKPPVKSAPIVAETPPPSKPIPQPEPTKPSKADPLRTDPFIPADYAAYTPPPANKSEPVKKTEPPKPTIDGLRKELREKTEQKPDPKPEPKPIQKPEPKKETAARTAPPPPPVAPPISKPATAKSRIPLLIGLGVAGVALIGIIGYFLLGNRSGSVEQPIATVSPTAAPQNAPSPAATSAFPEAAAPEGMVYILGGALRVGRDEGEENERPAHTVTIKPFYIDKYEVTNEQYQKFVDATSRTAPPLWNGSHFPENAEKLPVTDVSWEDATAYAAWASKRLPTEDEWEFAARGDQGRLFPWGDVWKPDTANAKASESEKRDLSPVGQYIAGASPFGLLDLSGNAWEWTSNEYKAYPGGNIEAPPAGFSNMKVIRGGSYQSEAQKATTTLRRGWPGSRDDWPKGRTPDYAQTGFRCAQDLKPQ